MFPLKRRPLFILDFFIENLLFYLSMYNFLQKSDINIKKIFIIYNINFIVLKLFLFLFRY